MKQIRVKNDVVVDAQTHRIGIVVVRMEKLTFLGNANNAEVGYYQQIEADNAEIGAPKYKLVPLPVKDAVAGKQHVKNVPLQKAVLDATFSQIGVDILATGSFVEQFTAVLTYATLYQMILDENYRKLNPDGTQSVMTADDWEIVEQQELVTS